ncbi:S locus F-box protein with the low allelic sequence polymorphism 1-S6 [Prunus yedoensis var. nudiflora]|uniref:S locus F-box protein with the low allelic sequence polymorphism 1-S6 n=1 Tax=Prunus yedoensis var. nudiflora TaxID=2094558 RepID=A0A314ZMY0_PRUYE|nr:S locus F-box protein with the low allelic sequence polymorphism 1-S6 [Prunus yedoensis var. nudiflora]
MLAKMLLMMMSKTSHSFVAEDIAREQCFGFEDLKSVTIHGHADGIIVLAESDNNMVLCNPATREFKKCASPDPGVGALGFRIDPKTRDFKVVNITENGEGDNDGDDEHLICNPPTIKLYTLSTDSWREINTDTLETETIYILPGCLQM